MELPLVVNEAMHCATAFLPCIDITCILLDYLLCMKIISLLVVIAIAIAIFLRQFCPRGKGAVRLPYASNCPKDTC